MVENRLICAKFQIIYVNSDAKGMGHKSRLLNQEMCIVIFFPRIQYSKGKENRITLTNSTSSQMMKVNTSGDKAC